jgi:glucose-1-phosphate adenylyltransferase
MITDGCEVGSGALVERSVLSPGVRVMPGAVVRESILLTDSIIESGSVVEQAIIDKKVQVGHDAKVGAIFSDGFLRITMIGKNSLLAPGITIEPGAVVATEVIPSDVPTNIVHSDDYIQTKRLPYEV